MKSLDTYTSKVFSQALNGILYTVLQNPILSPSGLPTAILLGGQSGSGKSTLHTIYREKLEGNVVVINGDEYRSLHPNFARIQSKYGLDAPAHTAKWAGEMVEALIGGLSDEGYNLIIEGTLRTSAIPLKTAQLLKNKGYKVSLALMAVKPEISLISCQIRYEQLRIAGTAPRAVDPKHHKKIVDDIVSNLGELEESDLFDSVSLYNRAEVCLFASQCPAPDKPASTVLHDILFGEWTEEERRHYADLQIQLEKAQSLAEGSMQ